MSKFLKLSLLLVLVLNIFGCSEEQLTDEAKAERKLKIKEDIQHHLKDAHDFHLFTVEGADGEEDTHYGFPLPVILIDGGLQVFMSSDFHHGEAVAESNGNFYKLYHGKIYKTDSKGTIILSGDSIGDFYTPYDGKIYKTDAEGTITLDDSNHPTNSMLSDISIEESIHPTNDKPFDISITKSVLSVILVSILIFFLFGRMAKNYKSSPLPKGFGKFVEPIIIFVRDEIAIPNIGEKYYSRYMSYLLTVFFFIWFINLTGLTPFGINVTGNIAVTSALAIMTFLITNFSGKKDYWKHIFWMPGVPTPMKFVLAPIELLGVIIKPFALLIRLYANISAGHIVLMSLIGLLFVFQNWFARGAFLGLTVFLSLIELLVAFLQAYIFTMLTALYFGMAVEEHDHEHAH
ncbi:MAG: F0F1 ATP synthase subunit A [Flavobacteriales bacterium]